MKTPSRTRLVLCALLAALLGLTGCSTIKSRIEEKQAVFDALPPEDQARILQGVVNLGFTPDMVYMALGTPDLQQEKTTADRRELLWVYNVYYQEYRGTVTTGYRRFVYYDPRAKAYRVYFEPVRTDVYEEREEEKIRITFTDGRVSAVEQSK